MRWSDLRDGVDIHEVLYTGPLVYLCVFLYVQSQCQLESPPLTSVEVTNVSTGLKISHSISADMSSSLNKVFQPVRNGDFDGLKAFFSTDDTIDLNQVNQSKLTPLMVACNRPSVSLDIIELLIVKGAKVDYQYNYDYSALMKALQVGKIKVEAVECLIKHGAQVNSKALEVCCEKGNVEVVKVLLQVRGIQDSLISGELSDYKYGDMVYSVSHCPFNTAIKNKHIQLVKWLLDSYMVTDIPVGVLFSAIESQSSEMVQLLLDYGTAQVHPTADGKTSALMLASYQGNSEIVKMLLEKGAKVNLQNEKKVSALILAAGQGNVEVLKQLLERGADVNLKGEGGSTALLSAFLAKEQYVPQWQANKVEMIKLLLNHDADVKVRDGHHTALSCAIAMKSIEIINLLLDKDKNLVNQPDLFFGHPLSSQISLNSPEIFELLLKAGAKVKDVPIDKGQTLLWYVRHVSIAKLLIEHGVDVNHLDDEGTCALQNAIQYGKHNLIRLLLENGADPTLCADGGKYILEWRKRTSSDTSHAVGEKRFKCEYR